MNKQIKYGWKPDLPDQRDYIYKVSGLLKFLSRWDFLARFLHPVAKDLSSGVVRVCDQGNLGSCVGNSCGSKHEFIRKKLGKPTWPSSRLFVYYNARLLEGTPNEDSGAYIRDGVKAIAKFGVPSELEWPYIIEQFATKPPQLIYDIAEKSQALVYERLPNQRLSTLRDVIHKGYPIVFGFSVYESFMTDAVAKTGIMPMPKKDEKLIGGHAVLVVGYDNKKRMFKILNSWGKDWGDGGYFYMPYEFIKKGIYCDDFWVLKTVE